MTPIYTCPNLPAGAPRAAVLIDSRAARYYGLLDTKTALKTAFCDVVSLRSDPNRAPGRLGVVGSAVYQTWFALDALCKVDLFLALGPADRARYAACLQLELQYLAVVLDAVKNHLRTSQILRATFAKPGFSQLFLPPWTEGSAHHLADSLRTSSYTFSSKPSRSQMTRRSRRARLGSASAR